VPVADHIRDSQVLDHDQVVAADQAGAGAVQEVAPGVADLAVRLGGLGPGLGPVRRAFLAARQPPLVAGQAAGRAKNAWKAACWWRSACCSGTEDTSFSQARPGSFFIAVSARSVCGYEVARCSVAYRWYRAARVRFHTTRAQPNVRASTCCCPSSG
jgi:hypothetical protein